MRITAWMLQIGLLFGMFAGCSTPRMLQSKSESPKPAPEERVKYGLPWSKDSSAGTKTAASGEMPPELKERLAQARAATDAAPKVHETLQRAAAAEARGDLDGARAAYLEVIAQSPQHAEAHHRLGVIADMSQDPQSADEHYAKAYAINPRDADLLSDMGYSLYLRGRFEAAELKLKEALECNPYHRSAQNNLGLVYGRQGKYDQALAMFRQAGTESEAQRNIQTLFPNGKPGETTSLASSSRESSQPLPMTPGTQGTGAPPMPPDIDRWPANTQDGRAGLTANTSPWGPEQTPVIGAAANSVAGQFGTSQQSPGTAAPAASHPGGTTAAASQGMWPTGMGAANSTAPAIAAKPQEPSEFWQGNAASTPPASSTNMAAAWPTTPSGAPPLPNANPWGTSAGTASPSPAGAWPNSGTTWPSTSSTIQPVSGVNAWPATGTGAGLNPSAASMPPTGAMSTGNSADASRWAAQMAFGAGPGSLFPTMTPGQSGVPVGTPATTMPGTSGAWGAPTMPAAPSNPWGVPATSGQSQWAYAETPAVPAASNATPPGGSASLWPAETATNVPAAAWQQLAPPSPWANAPTPSDWSNTWPPAQGSTGTAAAPANSSNPAFAGTTLWPGVESAPSAGSNSPAPSMSGSAGNGLPIVAPARPGSDYPAMSPANPFPTGSPSVSAPPNSSSTTTVPNWPYTPTRP